MVSIHTWSMMLLALGSVLPDVHLLPIRQSGRKVSSRGFHGKLSQIPPSQSSIESFSIGLNASGMAIEARTASPRSPVLSTQGLRATRSLATHRNGTMSRSKSPPEAVEAGVSSSASARSICDDEMRWLGSTSRDLFLASLRFSSSRRLSRSVSILLNESGAGWIIPSHSTFLFYDYE